MMLNTGGCDMSDMRMIVRHEHKKGGPNKGTLIITEDDDKGGIDSQGINKIISKIMR